MPQPSDSHVSHDDLVRLALGDLATVWANNEGSRSLQDTIRRVFPALVTKYGAGAAGLARTFFQSAILNVSDVPPNSRAEIPATGPEVPDDLVDRAFADSETAQAVLERGLRRFIGQAATDVIDHNFEAFDVGEKWARDTGGQSCAYCAMLASRGFVYNSEDAARRSGHVQKGRIDRCSIISTNDAAKAYLNGYDPNALFARYNDAAREVQADGLAVTDATVIHRMRDMFPDDFTDGHVVPSILGDVDAGWPRTFSAVTPGAWRHILRRHAGGGTAAPPHFDGLNPYEIAKVIRQVVADPALVLRDERLNAYNFIQLIDGVETWVGTGLADGKYKVRTAFPTAPALRRL